MKREKESLRRCSGVLDGITLETTKKYMINLTLLYKAAYTAGDHHYQDKAKGSSF